MGGRVLCLSGNDLMVSNSRSGGFAVDIGMQGLIKVIDTLFTCSCPHQWVVINVRYAVGVQECRECEIALGCHIQLPIYNRLTLVVYLFVGLMKQIHILT